MANSFKLKNYYKPTPKKWRKIGDSMLIGCTSLSSLMMGSPFSETIKLWSTFGLNGLGVISKVFTNMFKEEDPEPTEPTNPEINPGT